MKIMQRGLYDVKCNQCKAKPLIMKQLYVVSVLYYMENFENENYHANAH